MSNLIFINQAYLKHSAIISRLRECAPQHNWDAMLDTLKVFPRTRNMYCRGGVNVFPFRTDICDVLHARMPDSTNFREQSFAEITDQRCQELCISHGHKPWIIEWSGGIDSTVIITSFMRNLSAAQRQNITVACNAASVYEYPWFYENVIKPNFAITNTTITQDPQRVTNYFVITGEMGDQIYPGGIWPIVLQGGFDVNQNMFSSPDDLIAQLTKWANAKFAHWFYEQTITNIRSVDLPLRNYYDFYWWVSFNFIWTGIMLRGLRGAWAPNVSVKHFLDTVINWYDYPEYQVWSLSCPGPLTHTLGGYKHSSKEYIYSYTNDLYYLKFKVKVFSTSTHMDKTSWIGMTNDLKLLTLDDLPEILDLLPGLVQP